MLSVLEGQGIVFSVFLQRCSCLAPDNLDLSFHKGPALLFDPENSPGSVQLYQVLPTSNSFNNPPIQYLTPHICTWLCSGPSPGPCTGGGSCQLNLSPAQRHKGWTDPPILFLSPTELVVCSCLGRHIQTSHAGRH